MNVRHPWTALALLGWLAGCRYAWRIAPVQHQADAWNICQALAVAGCLALIAGVYAHSQMVLRVVALCIAWQFLTVASSVAYIIRPWDVAPGKEQLDALLHMPLGLFGMWLAVLLIACLAQGATKHGARTE